MTTAAVKLEGADRLHTCVASLRDVCRPQQATDRKKDRLTLSKFIAEIDKQVLACLTQAMSSERLPTAERRAQIAAAALRIISTLGVRRLTSAALAEQVGIADGTIFRHFKNKNEIVDAAIDLFEEAIEGAFPPEKGAPLERLGSFVVMRLGLVRERPEILRLAFNDRLAEAAGEEGAARVGRMVERSLTFVRRCLADAQERGEITRDAPLALLVWMVVGVIRGAAGNDIRLASQEGDFSRTTPEQVWASLEHFLRSTSKEKLP